MVLLGRTAGVRAADGGAAEAVLAVREAGFSLELAGDWVAQAGGGPEAWAFESRARRTRVEVSVIRASVPYGKLVQRAQAMADIRRNAERLARADRHVRFGEGWAELVRNGQAGHAAYAARDDEAIWRFMGWATARKLVGLTVETRTRDDGLSERVFDEVMAGFGFSVP
jgi:hypothetical protein